MDFQGDISNSEENKRKMEKYYETSPEYGHNKEENKNKIEKKGVTEVVVNNSIYGNNNDKSNTNDIDSISFEKPDNNNPSNIKNYDQYSNYNTNINEKYHPNIINNDIGSSSEGNQVKQVEQASDIPPTTHSTYVFCNCCRHPHTYCCYNLSEHCCSKRNCCTCYRCGKDFCSCCDCKNCLNHCCKCRCNGNCPTCDHICGRVFIGFCGGFCEAFCECLCQGCANALCTIF